MSEPVIGAADLALYLNDPSIDTSRADLMIEQAQLLCESVITPLPAGAEVTVMRVAGRGYVTTTTTRGAQMVAAGSPFGLVPGGMGGIFLTRQDRADLRRMAGGSNAFTINPLPKDYVLPTLPIWDLNNTDITIQTS